VPYDADEVSVAQLESVIEEDVIESVSEDIANDMPVPADYTALDNPAPQVTQSYEAIDYTRRRDDGPSGVLELSEVYDGEIDDGLIDDTYEVDDFNDDVLETGVDETSLVAESFTENASNEDALISNTSSRIADTASELSERLDALIDDVAADDGVRESKAWPESLIQSSIPQTGLADQMKEVEGKPADVIIDNLIEDDAFRERTDSAAKYINVEPPMESAPAKEGWGYYIPLFIGMCLIGASAGAIFGNPTAILGEWGPLLSFVGLLIGLIMIIFTLYYAVKAKVLNQDA